MKFPRHSLSFSNFRKFQSTPIRNITAVPIYNLLIKVPKPGSHPKLNNRRQIETLTGLISKISKIRSVFFFNYYYIISNIITYIEVFGSLRMLGNWENLSRSRFSGDQ